MGQERPVRGRINSRRKAPAQKTTGWITNSKEIADELAEFQCRNRAGSSAGTHIHGHVIGGRKVTGPAGEYPDLLVGAVLRGFRREMQRDRLEL